MAIDDDDWRLQGQEKYMLGESLQFCSWSSTNPKWDHDHCEFCSTKIASPVIEDALHEGYTTKDKYRWVCAECFNDFREKFKWVLIK